MNMINNNISKRIIQLLLKVGIDPSHVGYDYLREAIMLGYSDRKYLRNITSALYPKIAEINGVTITSVEKSIRHAISKIAILNPDAYRLMLFAPSDGHYTNSQFIACCVELLHAEESGNA